MLSIIYQKTGKIPPFWTKMDRPFKNADFGVFWGQNRGQKESCSGKIGQESGEKRGLKGGFGVVLAKIRGI